MHPASWSRLRVVSAVFGLGVSLLVFCVSVPLQSTMSPQPPPGFEPHHVEMKGKRKDGATCASKLQLGEQLCRPVNPCGIEQCALQCLVTRTFRRVPLTVVVSLVG